MPHIRQFNLSSSEWILLSNIWRIHRLGAWIVLENVFPWENVSAKNIAVHRLNCLVGFSYFQSFFIILLREQIFLLLLLLLLEHVSSYDRILYRCFALNLTQQRLIQQLHHWQVHTFHVVGFSYSIFVIVAAVHLAYLFM